MKVLVVKPNQIPFLKEIGTDLRSLQEAVDGDIQVTYPFDDKVGLLCNEEGKILGMPLNRALYMADEMYDIVAGTFIVCGLSSDNFKSLSDDLAQKYYEFFKYPEYFYKTLDGDIKAEKITNVHAPDILDVDISEPIVEDILTHLNYDSMHVLSITKCDDDAYQRHEKEVEKVFKGLAKLDSFQNALVVETKDFDIAHKNREARYYLLNNLEEFESFLTAFDFKNGVDIGISNDGSFVLINYGSNYEYRGYVDTNKKLITMHPVIDKKEEDVYEIDKEQYDSLNKVDVKNELIGLKEGVFKSIERDLRKQKEQHRDR